MALDYNGSHNLMRFPNFKLKALSLSFDDGLKTDERLVKIILDYGLKGTFNLNSGYMADKADQMRLDLEKACNLYLSSGMEVAVHGGYHVPVDKVDTAIAVNDLIRDRVSLEKIFGRVIKGMAYPLGSTDLNSKNVAKSCGFKYARTINDTEKFNLPEDWLMLNPTTSCANSKTLELIKEFVSLGESQYFWFNEPRFFCLWGHSFDFIAEKDWDKFIDFAKIVSNASDIWLATVGEVHDYVQAFERLEFSADGICVKNPSATDVYIKYYNGKNVVVPAGKTINL